jgi:ketosteroid isomerase-like protein
MQPIQTAITGNEGQGDPSSPYRALVQFYYAFNHRDIDRMADNWAQTDEIAMDNPLGGIKRGWSEIRPVYERIFRGPAEVKIEFHDYTIHEGGDMFYAVGRERGHLQLGDSHLDLAIRTSHVFRKLNGRWQQVHHHGSIDESELLELYQMAVLSKSGVELGARYVDGLSP